MKFLSEAELCASFIPRLPDGWVAYPETADFDIVLVRKADGFQIGVEAKLRLNPRVISQVIGDRWYETAEPDCLAVLVPDDCGGGDLASVCGLLGVTVVRNPHTLTRLGSSFWPNLPGGEYISHQEEVGRVWYERCPAKRLKLPEYIPDVEAGRSGPVKLTEWKVKAIKIAVTLARRGFVTRKDFVHIGIDARRWLYPNSWLAAGADGASLVAGPNLPDFKAMHPKNWEQIDADFDKWAPPRPSLDLIGAAT